MTGIIEMFRDLDEGAHYDCSMQLELWGWRQRAAQRERQRRWRMMLKCNKERREARRAYQRVWLREYSRRKRRTDPKWVENRRALNRKAGARYRAKTRALEAV
jgi:hypothetical protein